MIFSNGAEDLPAKDVPLLFDRFFRVSHSRTRGRKDHSSGLGLSIVKQLCLTSGGTVHAEVRDNRLSVIVRLPLERGFCGKERHGTPTISKAEIATTR